MAFNLNVIDPMVLPQATQRRVTLVHFARAITGFAEKFAPDLDTRGGGVIRAGKGQAHGPVVGLIGNATGTAKQQIRIKLMRVRIDDTQQLFPEITGGAAVTLVHPSPGQPLSTADIPAAGSTPERLADCVYLECNSDGAGDPEVKLLIHYGTSTGPVIAEMGVVVYSPLIIPIQIHKVTINGPTPGTDPVAAACSFSDPDIRSVFDDMDKIYTQAGMRVTLRDNFLVDTVNNFTERGTVTLTNVADQRNQELQTILNTNTRPDVMNCYIFNRFRDITQAVGRQFGVLGIAFSQDDVRANPPASPFPGCQAGFTMRIDTDLKKIAHTAAHEIGHTLRLQHYGGRGSIPDMIDEIWTNRNLMRNLVSFQPNGAAHREVGYLSQDNGNLRAGSWLGTKKSGSDGSLAQPDQIRIMREAAAAGSYKPIIPPTLWDRFLSIFS